MDNAFDVCSGFGVNVDVVDVPWHELLNCSIFDNEERLVIEMIDDNDDVGCRCGACDGTAVVVDCSFPRYTLASFRINDSASLISSSDNSSNAKGSRYGDRSIRRKTIRRDQFVAINSSHDQFVAEQFVAFCSSHLFRSVVAEKFLSFCLTSHSFYLS